MAVGYFGENYWATNYWASNYWAEPPEQGDFWPTGYWASDYWATNYWAADTSGPGDIVVTDDATLSLTQFNATVQSGPVIQATTPTLTLTALDATAGNNFDLVASFASLPLAAHNPDLGISGYVAGDIDLFFSPESAITVTYGFVPPTPAIPMQAFKPTTSTENGIDIAVGNTAELGLTAFVTDAANVVDVQPVPQVLTLTAYDSPAAGIGELIKVSLASRSLTPNTHLISGVPVADVRQTFVARLAINGLTAGVTGRPPLGLPEPTFPPDDSIENEDAIEWPSEYEICDRTGFKLRIGSLTKEWTGVMVRPESWERRHPQDFVRGVSDHKEGSPRPEPADRFIDDEYPAGVTVDDL